jgi:hypothetical protein
MMQKNFSNFQSDSKLKIINRSAFDHKLKNISGGLGEQSLFYSKTR